VLWLYTKTDQAKSLGLAWQLVALASSS